MALAIGEKIRLDTDLKDGSHLLLTLSTLEGKSGALPSPLPVNNVVRLFKLKLPIKWKGRNPNCFQMFLKMYAI